MNNYHSARHLWSYKFDLYTYPDPNSRYPKFRRHSTSLKCVLYVWGSAYLHNISRHANITHFDSRFYMHRSWSSNFAKYLCLDGNNHNSVIDWRHGWSVFCMYKYALFACEGNSKHFIWQLIWLSTINTFLKVQIWSSLTDNIVNVYV